MIVTQNEVEPYAFSHPKLFVPNALMVESAPAPVKTAQAETTASDAPAATSENIPLPDYPPIADVTADIRKSIHDENPDAKKRPAPTGPVSVFISRKERKLYVRQGMIPLSKRSSLSPTTPNRSARMSSPRPARATKTWATRA